MPILISFPVYDGVTPPAPVEIRADAQSRTASARPPAGLVVRFYPDVRLVSLAPAHLRLHHLSGRLSALCRGAHGREAAAPGARRFLGRLDHLPGLLPDRAPARLSLCPLARPALLAAPGGT